MNSNTMTETELRDAAIKHDRIHNEGGEGYNPYRAELAERHHIAALRTRDDIIHDLSVCDTSGARESGTYNDARVNALRAELADTDKSEADAFAAEWTLEVTQARRAAWNAEVDASIAKGIKPDGRLAYKIEQRLGYTLDDLKRAKALHNM
jgi:hypothetical protein